MRLSGFHDVPSLQVDQLDYAVHQFRNGSEAEIGDSEGSMAAFRHNAELK
jgi:hypothetical protein